MIVLDTHVWVWWVHADANLSAEDVVRLNEAVAREGAGVSAISCWEVAKLVEYGRLALPISVQDWIATGLSYPGVELVPLSPEIAVASTTLPGEFHRDPADQIIVATARTLGAQLATADHKILAYPHVQKWRLGA